MDPRLVLAEKLISIGVENKLAYSIALDAGSSQCVVNKPYLEHFDIPEEIINDSLDVITLFYCGDLVEEY